MKKASKKRIYIFVTLVATSIIVYLSVQCVIDIAIFSANHSASESLMHLRIHSLWSGLHILSLLPVAMLSHLLARIEQLYTEINAVKHLQSHE